MKVLVVSDLHLEFDNKIDLNTWPDADILAFCGDIGVGASAVELVADAAACGKFDKVFYLMGNHEGYNQVWEDVQHQWREAAQKYNFHFLDGTQIFEIGDFLITGATLWTDLGDPADAAIAQYYMNDYYKIRSIASFPPNEEGFADKVLTVDIEDRDTWAIAPPATRATLVKGQATRTRAITPQLTTIWHRLDVELIDYAKDMAKQLGKKLLVFTHHTPSKLCLNLKHSRGNSNLNPAYYTDLENLMEGITLWGCGHTHNRLTAEINGCKLVMNGRGYVGTYFEGGAEIKEPFKPFVVEV